MLRRLVLLTTEEKVELFHIFYRWANVAFVSLLLISSIRTVPPTRLVIISLAMVITYTSLLTVYYKKIHRVLLKNPSLLLIDFLFVNLILAMNGGYRSPYLLYSYAPLLVGSYFFLFKGAAVGAVFHASLYTVVLYLTGHTYSWFVKRGVLDYVMADYLSIFLIAFFFAIPARLVQLLRERQAVLERLKDQLSGTNQKLAALQRVSTVMQTEKKLDEILNLIFETVTRELNFERIILGFADREKGVLGDYTPYGFDPEEFELPNDVAGPDISIRSKKGVAATAIVSKRPYNVKKYTKRDRGIEYKFARLFHSTAFAVVPLLVLDKPVGVIWVDRGKTHQEIKDEEVDLLASFASHAAVAIENARLYTEIKELAAAEERNRLARDVHDGLAQSLSSIVYQLEVVHSQIKNTPGQALERIKRLQEFASRNLREAREYIFELRGGGIKEHSLASALAKYAEEFNLNTGINTVFKVNGKLNDLVPEAETALYWVAREALNNVFKHSQASEAKIELSEKETMVRLVVKDNGRGCSQSEYKNVSEEKFGIKGMKERVGKLGGALKIEGKPGSGFKVIASISDDHVRGAG